MGVRGENKRMRAAILLLVAFCLSVSHQTQDCTTDGAFNVPGIVYSSVKTNIFNGSSPCAETCIGKKGVGMCSQGVYGALAGLTNMTCAERNYTEIITTEYRGTICNGGIFQQFYRVYG